MTIRSIALTVTMTIFGIAACNAQILSACDTPMSETTFGSLESVYHKWRRAYIERDWQTVWACLTREAQESLIFEAYFACKMNESDQMVRDCLDRHGLFDVEIERRYKQLIAEIGAKPKSDTPTKKLNDIDEGPPTNAAPQDDHTELLQRVVNELVLDKAEYHSAVADLMQNFVDEAMQAKRGPLQSLSVDGRNAFGVAGLEMFHLRGDGDGGKYRVESTTHPTRIIFKKEGDTWLIHTETPVGETSLLLPSGKESDNVIMAPPIISDGNRSLLEPQKN